MNSKATLFPEDPGMGPMGARFWAFHDLNPGAYELISRFAQEAISKGRDRISINMIFERARWYSWVETQGDGFKLNNNYRAFYARLWLRDHPANPDCFATREQKIDMEGAA